MTISNPNMATNAPIYLQTPIPSVAIFKPKMSIFTDTALFLLSHHHVFVLTNQILLTQHMLPNQLIFAATTTFCLLS